MTTSVLLIRHGDYVHRPSPAGEAASDLGLSPQGEQQAAALRGRLAADAVLRPAALYCSTLPRARQTAERIAPALALTVQALDALCEWESGNEVLGIAAFAAQFDALPPAQRRQHRFAPGCETIAEFDARVRTALAALIERHAGQALALVVHGGVIEVAFSHLLGFGPGPFEGGFPAADHTSLTLWQHGGRRQDAWMQVYANDTRHLDDTPRSGHVGVGVGVLVVRDGRLLLGRRQGAHGAGTWAAPGGRLEFGETIEACARRELREETGLEAEGIDIGPSCSNLFAEVHQHHVTVFTVAQAIRGEAQNLEPHKCEGWQWHAWDALPQPLFAPLSSLLATGYRPPGA